MRKEVINPSEMMEPVGFNHGILVEGGSLLFLAGQDGQGPDGEAPDDIVGQFERAMADLATVCEEAGGSSEDIVKLNVFVDDRDEYRAHLEEIGEVFGQYVDDYPAMALFEVSDFFEDVTLVELEGFAVIAD